MPADPSANDALPSVEEAPDTAGGSPTFDQGEPPPVAEGAASDADLDNLISQLTSADPEERFGAMDSIAKIGSSAVPRLIECLESPDAELRLTAVLALGSMKTNALEAVPSLTKCLGDEEAGVRANAAGVLGLFGVEGRSALPSLIKCFSDPKAVVRRNAVAAVAEMGPDAQSAVSGLTALKDDPHEGVRKAAEEALAKLSGAGEE